MKINNLLKKYIFLKDEHNEIIQNIDFSKTSISNVVKATKDSKYSSKVKNKDLSDYIFKFYAYNEILASFREKSNGIVSKEDLNIFKEYGNFVNDFSKRVFAFILHASLAEVKHCDFFQDIDDNSDYMDALKEHVTETVMTEIKDGKKTKTTNFVIAYLKDEYSTKDYKEILNNPSILQKEIQQIIDSYYLDDFTKKDIVSFKKIYINKDNLIFEKNSTNFFNEYLKENNLENDVEKSERFKNFINFIKEIYKTDLDGDDGDLQRKIIKSSMIETSTIKDFSVEEILEFLSITFSEKFQETDGYGGEPWSDIVKHALSFARGEINTEIFIDQALSLEHNNGQMFNKNFIFKDSESVFTYSYVNNYYEKDIINSINMNANNILFNLQSSCSVLSLFPFFDDKNSNLINLELLNNVKESCPNIIKNNIYILNNNFSNFKELKEEIVSFSEMKDLAQKVGYSIPSFNFYNFIINSLEKVNKNEVNNVENCVDSNNILSEIMEGKYSTTNIKEINAAPSYFKLHNLNSSNSKTLTKELVGGKAYGLTSLINKGFNVPKALVFDTKTCLSYLSNKKYFKKEYKGINQQISDYLIDDNKQPLLVSVRSGAPVSMPGMMDSILNVGIDDSTYLPLCKIYGKKVIDQCAISFMSQFCSSKFDLNIQFPKNFTKALDRFAEIIIRKEIPCDRRNLFPLSKEEQIKLSVEAVFDSWNSPRAIAWRNEKNIDHNMGTAATVQQMVFGNKNDKSFTCVIFSRDCITGKPDLMGEYLQQAQGEDLVAGKRTPFPISELKVSQPKIYQEIEFIAKTLEEEQKAIQDLEITVEDGKVFVLQMRNAVVSPEAQLSLAKDMNLNLLDVIQPKSLIGNSKIDTLLTNDFNGLTGSPGLISGVIVRNQEDIDKYKSTGKELIFFSNQALPEHAPIMIATQGFVTEVGGATSHAAILARSMGKPCVVGIGKQESNNLESGSLVTIDASEGKIWKGELDIVVNQEKAIDLANQVLKENNIKIPDKLPENNILVKSWTTGLLNFKLLERKQTNKHNMFLNIAQQTALVLQMEHVKNYAQHTQKI